jgi:hypothetical protein
MRSYLPLILVLLGLFTGACIAYIAWELSADNSKAPDPKSTPESSDQGD